MRRLFLALGLVLLVGLLVVTAAFGLPGQPVTLAQFVLTLVAALLLVGSWFVPAGATLRWYHLVGVGDVLLGLGMVAAASRTWFAGADLVYTVASVGGGLVLILIGVQFVRGSGWYRLEE